MIRPFHSVGLLFHDDPHAQPQFAGSCFAFKRPHLWLTAKHCIGQLPAHQLHILLPLKEQWPSLVRVDKLALHPEADLALVRTRELPEGTVLPFDGVSALQDWGESVMALGYPEESTSDGIVPSARLFSGSIQRRVTYDSPLGHRYLSGELSFGAPAGLSGGPVFPTREPHRVVGLVAENRDSSTYLRAVEEVQEDGKLYREHFQEVIRFGVYVELSAYLRWIDATVAELEAA